MSQNTNNSNGSSGGGDDNDNGKNEREKNEAQPTEAASMGAMGARVAIRSRRQKKTESESRCCLALAIILCKIPNSTVLSMVDAKCQLYHKTKGVDKHFALPSIVKYRYNFCMRI